MTEGGMDVSKCPFPRHCVVFYAADGQAASSVSVCFECGDIPDVGAPSRRKADRHGVYTETFMKRYDAVMERWRTWFTAQPDMPPEWKASTKTGPMVTP